MGRGGAGLSFGGFGLSPSFLVPHWVSGSCSPASEGQMRRAVDFSPLAIQNFPHINTEKDPALSSLLWSWPWPGPGPLGVSKAMGDLFMLRVAVGICYATFSASAW